nr:two-component regulator propeller domain-containing protein [Pseudoduganella armeniaca]
MALLLRLFLAALLLAASTASAAPARSLRFEQLGVADGLAQESVLAIAQDRQGFMWFGSQGGLSRFDGYRTVVYRHTLSDPHSLAENWVRVVHIDAVGRMWVGTDNGLDRFDPLTQRFTHYRPDEPEQRGNGNRHVRAIIDDGAGGLWVGTADGLQRFDPVTGRFTLWHNEVANARSLAHDQINALARDRAGRLWIGTPAGVDMLLPGAQAFRHFAVRSASGRPVAVQALLMDSEQTLWLGTHEGVERWQLGPGGWSRTASGSMRRMAWRPAPSPRCTRTANARSGSACATRGCCAGCRRPAASCSTGTRWAIRTAWPTITCPRCSATASARCGWARGTTASVGSTWPVAASRASSRIPTSPAP